MAKFGSVTGRKKWRGGIRGRRKLAVAVDVWRSLQGGYSAQACIKRSSSAREVAGKTALSRCGGSIGLKTASAAVKAALTNLSRSIKK